MKGNSCRVFQKTFGSLTEINQRRENEFGELGNGGRVGMMQMDFPGGEGGKEPA